MSLRAWRIVCHGSGRIREDLVAKYNSPFAIETATFAIRNSDVCAEVTRSLFDTARQYRESIDVYGDKQSVEWPLIEHEPLVIHTAKKPEPKIPSFQKCPDFAKRLPKLVVLFFLIAKITDALVEVITKAAGSIVILFYCSYPLLQCFLLAVESNEMLIKVRRGDNQFCNLHLHLFQLRTIIGNVICKGLT